MTNSERAAKTILVRFKLRSYDADEIRAIIRREIPGCDDLDALRKELTYQGESHQQAETLYKQQLDALRRRVAVMRQSLLRYGRHDDEDVGPQPCRSHECGPDTCDCGLDAALSTSPPVSPDPNAEIVRRLVEWNEICPSVDISGDFPILTGIIRDAAALRAGAGGGV